MFNDVLMSEGKEFKAAVAVVRDSDRWLLGLSTSTDQRRNKWCMPGGGIKGNESWKVAAERECYEETGIRCTALGGMFEMRGYPRIAFVPCKVTRSKQPFKMNDEFKALGWFKESDLYQLKLFDNVRELISKAKNWRRR